jgi:hypothetical protein
MFNEHWFAVYIIISVAPFISRWSRARNFVTFKGLLLAFLTNPRSFKTRFFRIIWTGVKKMHKLPDAPRNLKEHVFNLLLEIAEEAGDADGLYK